jgi:amino acid adenylation domain-containing protein
MELSEDRRRLLERMIRGGAAPKAAAAPVVGPRTEPASFAQRRLWFLEQLQQAEVPYTLHAVQHLRLALDPGLLERAANEVVRRHEVLRTTFALRDDEPVQNVAAEARLAVPAVDLRDLPEEARRPEALRRMAATIARRFDLERGPLLRLELYRLDDADWLLLLTVHHLVFDGPSFSIFFRELEAIYGALAAGDAHGLPSSHDQYAAFAREQRARLTPEKVAAEVAFWRAELAGVPMLDLPADRPRSLAPTFRGGNRDIELPAELVTRLQGRTAGAQATLFTLLFAGLAASLSRLCGQDDFAIGLPVTGRDTMPRQDALGFYVDTVVVRARVEGDPTADELVASARGAVNRGLAHRALPFDMLVQHLRPERDLGVNPFFQVGFQLMQYPVAHAESAALDIDRSSAMFDLGLDLWMKGEGIAGRLQYNSDLFDPPTVDLVVRGFHAALEWLLEPDRRLSQLRIGAGADAADASILRGEAVPLAGRSCMDLVAAAAETYPDLPALADGARTLTYAELMDRVERLAGAVAGRGIAPGAIVLLELERSIELTCLQMALMRARAAFACLDPGWPAARRARIAEDARPALVVDARVAAELEAEADGPAPADRPGPEDAAYLIFTSGSTGEPKGVVVEHGGLLNVAHAQRHVFGLGPGRRVAQLASPTFDASVFETVMALCAGATLVVAPPGILAGEALERFIDRNGVDSIVVPPSVLATLPPGGGAGLRLVCVAGESCPADLAQRFRAGREFWNLYGPTETTIWATYGRRGYGARVSIGRPVPNLVTAVVDGSGRVVPAGMVGELCVAGPGVARGYLNRPEQTTERFVQGIAGLPGRAYRTGDLVRQSHDGELVFLGRADRQVKVRGLRIEPEEVETVLRGHPAVTDVVVGAFPAGGEPALVAYLQAPSADGNAVAVVDACRRRVRERLPSYMCPSHFVVLPAFPRSASGKVDVRALPAPGGAASGREYVEPSTPTERRVAELMAQLAHVPRVGASDDFFQVGGHSLAAVQLASRARAAFGVELTIGDVFSHSTVSAFAARVDALRETAPEVEEVPLVRLPRGRRVTV